MNIRHIMLLLSIILNIVVVYSLVWGQQGVLAYKELTSLNQKLEHTIAELDEKNVLLSQEIRLLQTDEKYIEKVIRKRLNFVRSNEIIYIFPEKEDNLASGALAHESKD